MAEEEITTEVAQLQLPPELLDAVRPEAAAPQDLKVDGWTPSLMERLARLFGLG